MPLKGEKRPRPKGKAPLFAVNVGEAEACEIAMMVGVFREGIHRHEHLDAICRGETR